MRCIFCDNIPLVQKVLRIIINKPDLNIIKAETQVDMKRLLGARSIWYDPTNSAISPRLPKINLWEYDEKAKMKCLQKNYDMKASAFCGKYECKIEVIGR